jgi:hypothetical protein
LSPLSSCRKRKSLRLQVLGTSKQKLKSEAAFKRQWFSEGIDGVARSHGSVLHLLGPQFFSSPLIDESIDKPHVLQKGSGSCDKFSCEVESGFSHE